jgi:hypothetical protein
MVTLLVGLTFSEIVLLYWFFLPMVVRLFYEGYIAKNRRWVADNPAFQERFPSPRYSIWFSYLVGSAWIALSVRVYFFERAWLLKSIFFPGALVLYPTVLFGVLSLLYACVEHFRRHRRIPLADRRRASLDRRELRDFLNPGWVYLGYLFLVGIIVANVIAVSRGLVDARPTILPRMITLVLCAVILALTLKSSLRRKEGFVDNLFGSSYRKFEVILLVAGLYVIVLGGGLSTLYFVGHISVLPSPVTCGLATSAAIQLLVLYMLLGMPFFPKENHPNSTRGIRRQLGENQRAG